MHDGRIEQIAHNVCAQKGFTFVRRVGAGASKETFAVDGPGGPVALKIYRQGSSDERNVREVMALQACDHPNIGKVIEFGEIAVHGESTTYALEELLTGGTLSDHMSILTRENGMALGRALIDAVAHLSARSLVHRDIKPDNILYREPGNIPVLIDFSIVRDLTETSLTQTWMGRGPGTPIFASPEQLNNEKGMIDWRCDQFSLGLVLSIALLKLHPYDVGGTPPHLIVERMAHREPQSAHFVERAKADGLEVLIKMTSRWPIERYRKPEVLLSDWP
jgi:serine/threonine protein kinase